MSGARTRPCVLLETGDPERLLRFADPSAILIAREPAEVMPTLAVMEAARRAGKHLAGYAAYELGACLEPRLAPLIGRASGALLVFGVFDAPPALVPPPVAEPTMPPELTPAWSARDHARRFERVIEYIRAGDVYQVNLTFPLRGRFRGDALGLHASLRRAQPTSHGAFVSLDEVRLLSYSPEMFFEIRDGVIRARPMKGTAPRGADAAEDAAHRATLAASEKDRAENLMITDLLRNDLGRLAEIGSVKVTDLFSIEAHPTLFQMTSGIEARLKPEMDLPSIFRALFPCGSVTGAPKIRAMEIIAELEEGPRGPYCGAIGWLAPNGDARFNVAIRTLVLHEDGEAVLNVGSGVVHDSRAQLEYDECLLKARFLKSLRPS